MVASALNKSFAMIKEAFASMPRNDIPAMYVLSS